MRIDGVDSLRYGVQQWTVEPDYCSVKNSSEWIAGSSTPLMLKGVVGFKKLKVSVMIRGNTRQEIWERSSDFIASLIQPRTFKFDGFDHSFYLYLNNASQAEKSLKKWHKATLELVGYEYGDEVKVKVSDIPIGGQELLYQNAGNLETPVIIEFVPAIGVESLTINGFGRNAYTGKEEPYIINNLTKGQKVKIDGESGLVTEAGKNKFADIYFWQLPTFLPGLNKVTVDKALESFTVTYKPRYF